MQLFAKGDNYKTYVLLFLTSYNSLFLWSLIEDKLLHVRAYFSVQYCTLCAVLMAKCAVLNVKMCSIEI